MGSLTQIHETLRSELNGCLAREAFSDAHEIQNCILLLLDSMNGAQPLERPARMLSGGWETNWKCWLIVNVHVERS